MSAIFSWSEDNGASTGNPAAGATRTTGVLNVNWKSVDDATTAYGSSPVTAGNNSYPKFQFGVITGSFTQVNNVKWAKTAGTVNGTSIQISGAVTTGYQTPSTGFNSYLTIDMSSTTSISAGASVTLGTVGPQQAGSTSLTSPGYTAYLVSQMFTTSAASAGDIGAQTFTLRYDEQ